ncbi:MAG: M48 family metalloprotease [Candidatus Atabeyarchaeum deiterrae]
MNLGKLAKEVSVKIGLEKIPKIAVSVDAHYADTKYGRISIAPILVSSLSEQQMRSVIAHEGYHCRNYWRRLCLHIMLLIALEILSAIIFVVMYPMLAAALPPFVRCDVTLLAILAVLYVSYRVSILISRWRDRRDELRADTLAAKIAGKKSIRQALRLMYGNPEKHGLIGRMKRLFDTHPCIQKRFENIAGAPRKQRNCHAD